MPKFELKSATKKQLEIIKTGLDHISSVTWEELGKHPYNIYTKPGKPTTVFLVRHQDAKFLNNIKDKRAIEHSGIFFGYIKKGDFQLSLEGAEFLILEVNNRVDIKLKKITLNEAGAKSFLYGNSLKPFFFAKSPELLNKKDLIFVNNPNEVFIGIGFIFKRDENVELRNLVDYGYYLRRGY
ncbi:MAG: hypothetical protein GY870_05840 [archaeon]|nr:hypothetical protein [archaeon]